jgi:hypothetical protein
MYSVDFVYLSACSLFSLTAALAQAVALLTFIREVSESNLGWDTDHTGYDFPNVLNTNSEKGSEIRSLFLLPISFQFIH